MASFYECAKQDCPTGGIRASGFGFGLDYPRVRAWINNGSLARGTTAVMVVKRGLGEMEKGRVGGAEIGAPVSEISMDR